MKIKSLHIKNFKSIVDLTINEPNPFTVFVGPNGSGKSNIFEALEYMALMSTTFGDSKKEEILSSKFGENILPFNKVNTDDHRTIIGFEFGSHFSGWIRDSTSDEVRAGIKLAFPPEGFEGFVKSLGKEFNIPDTEIEKRLVQANLPELTSKFYRLYDKEYVSLPLFAEKDKLELFSSYNKNDIAKYVGSISKLVESIEYEQFFHFFLKNFCW